MQKILYLTFYFEPDLSAGSFRNTALAKELANQARGRALVHVITTQPNRYHSFKEKARPHEQYDNLIIDRIEVAEHKNGFLDQVNTYRTYYRQVMKITAKEKYDLVFVSSSRLFSSYLGRRIAAKSKCPLYLDIRDLFVDNMKEIIRNPLIKYPLHLLLRYVEKTSFGYATHINLVSEGFKNNFLKYREANYTYYPNGIDDAFLEVEQDESIRNQKPRIITYAGNIGEGQGLHKIIPAAAEKLRGEYHFRVIGDGGIKALLQQMLDEKKLDNVELIEPVKRDKLIEFYRQSHFLLMHLNTYKAFEKVLPSKLFEYGATNLPMLAGVGGYARTFVATHISNSLAFDPCDHESLVNLLKNYEYKTERRTEFLSRFKRATISGELAKSILSYLPAK